MRTQGFTLPETLIVLGILAIIATFTIPKLLSGNISSQVMYEKAKSSAMTISNAYVQYQLDAKVTASTQNADLLPYLNYVKADSTTIVDDVYNDGSHDCATYSCYTLHNGANLHFPAGRPFGSTDSTSAIMSFIDPDNQYSGSTTGEGKSIQFFLYYDGRLRTIGDIEANTYVDGDNHAAPEPNGVPPYWTGW